MGMELAATHTAAFVEASCKTEHVNGGDADVTQRRHVKLPTDYLVTTSQIQLAVLPGLYPAYDL